MLKVSLTAVDRQEVRLQEEVPLDHPMWEDAAVELLEPLKTDLTARSVGEGVLVRGALHTRVRLSCRRCLNPVEEDVHAHVDLFYTELGEDEEEMEGEVYSLPGRGSELDLTEAVREQLLLQVPEYALCDEACRGLCPQCGTDLNEGACDCVSEAAPSPWDALKKLKLD